MEQDLEEVVNKLSARVAHLEDELETSYMRESFERSIDSIAPKEADTEISDGAYGYHARITGITGDQAQMIIDSVELRDDYDCAVTETGVGLGVEVWNEVLA